MAWESAGLRIRRENQRGEEIFRLNGKSQTLDFIECRIKTVSGFLKITKETIIRGNAPTSSNYIPVVAGHSNSNDVSENVFYDSSSWYIRSNVAQEITIRFYKTAK